LFYFYTYSFLAIVIMTYGAINYPKILKLANKSSHKSEWKIAFGLIIFTLVSYVTFIILYVFGSQLATDIITISIFYFVSVYVLQTIDLLYKTLKESFQKNNDINKYADHLEVMVQKRTQEYQNKNEEIEKTVNELTDFKKAMLSILEDMSNSEDQLKVALMESDALNMVSQTITWSADWDKMVSYVTKVIALNMEAPKSAIFIYNSDSNSLVAQKGSYGFTPKEIELLDVDTDESLNGIAYKTKTVIQTSDIQSEKNACPQKVHFDHSKMITAPVYDGKNIIGTICCIDPNRDIKSSKVKDFYEKLSNVASVIISNSKLINQIEVKESEEQAILKSIGEGLLVVDNLGNIEDINKIAENNFGIKKEDVLGKNVAGLLGFHELETLLSDFGATYDRKHVEKMGHRMECILKDEKYICAAGKNSFHKNCRGCNIFHVAAQKKMNLAFTKTTNFTFSAIISPILSDSSEVIGQVLTMHDVTKEVLMNRAKDEFLSVTSHELRTPMTAVMGNIKMVLDGDAGKVDDMMREYLNDAYIGSQRLLALVEDMLNVSRIEQGRMQYNISPFDIDTAIKYVFNTLKGIASQKNLYLKPLNHDCVKVVGDENKIIEVITNLVGNALKFTEGGGISIGYAIVGNKLQVSIADTGIGISKEDETKLFQKFSQVNLTLTNQKGGTGLGLYICRQYVEAMGGKIWIDKSEPGRGTIFAFTLPLA